MRLMRGSGGRPSSPCLILVGCRSGFERLNGDTAASMVAAACDVEAGSGMCCPARASLDINASPIYCRRHSPKSVAGLSGSSVLNVMLQDWFHSSPGKSRACTGWLWRHRESICRGVCSGNIRDTRVPLHCHRTQERSVDRKATIGIAPFAVDCPVLARKRARRSGLRPSRLLRASAPSRCTIAISGTRSQRRRHRSSPGKVRCLKSFVERGVRGTDRLLRFVPLSSATQQNAQRVGRHPRGLSSGAWIAATTMRQVWPVRRSV
jgi:hypothetical protein